MYLPSSFIIRYVRAEMNVHVFKYILVGLVKLTVVQPVSPKGSSA